MKTQAKIRNLALAGLASLSLGGCYYGDVYGASFADYDCAARYGDRYWLRDPFAYDDGYFGYDCYDAADYRSGFLQIGFGGGWYQRLYYPGYGLFLFDRYGRRYPMSHDYLTYWGGRRAWWRHHGHRYRDGWRPRDRHYDGPRPGRGYNGGYGPNSETVPPPAVNNGWQTDPPVIPAPRERRRGEGWRNRPSSDFDAPPIAAPGPEGEATPRPEQGVASGWRGGNWMPPPGAVQPPVRFAPPASTEPPVSYAPPARAPRIPQYRDPTIGNDGVAAVPVSPAPPVRAQPRSVPIESFTPPPQSRRSDGPRIDPGGPEHED